VAEAAVAGGGPAAAPVDVGGTPVVGVPVVGVAVVAEVVVGVENVVVGMGRLVGALVVAWVGEVRVGRGVYGVVVRAGAGVLVLVWTMGVGATARTGRGRTSR
jgi:hypothetical protein